MGPSAAVLLRPELRHLPCIPFPLSSCAPCTAVNCPRSTRRLGRHHCRCLGAPAAVACRYYIRLHVYLGTWCGQGGQLGQCTRHVRPAGLCLLLYCVFVLGGMCCRAHMCTTFTTRHQAQGITRGAIILLRRVAGCSMTSCASVGSVGSQASNENQRQ